MDENREPILSQPTMFQIPHVDAPIIKHEAPKDICDEGDENMYRLLHSVRCVRCTKMFIEDENADGACSYHPGPVQTALRKLNHLDRITYLCCGGVQIGFNPILTSAVPCKSGRHFSAEDRQAQLDAARGFRAAAATAASPASTAPRSSVPPGTTPSQNMTSGRTATPPSAPGPTSNSSANLRTGATPKPPTTVRPSVVGRRAPSPAGTAGAVATPTARAAAPGRSGTPPSADKAAGPVKRV